MKINHPQRIICLVMLVFTLLLSSCTGSNHQLIDTTATSEMEKSPTFSAQTITPSSIPTVLFETKSQTPVSIPEEWIKVDHHSFANQIQVMLLDSAGNLWAGGPSGVTEWDVKNQIPTIYTLFPESNKTHVFSIAQTSDHDIWVGTFGNGLSRYDGKEWQIYSKENGLPSNYINSVIATSENKLWIDPSSHDPDLGLLEGARFGIFDGQRWTTGIGGGFFKMVGSLDGTIWALEEWVNQYAEPTIVRFDGKEWNLIGYGHNHPVTSAITVAPDQKIWVAARDGIYIYNGQTWGKMIPPWIGETVADVSTIAVSQDGSAWFGFSYGGGILGYGACGDRLPSIEEWGVYHWDGSTWKHYTDKDGLIDNKICDIKIGNDGSIWFGSFDRGISRLKDNQWTSYILQ